MQGLRGVVFVVSAIVAIYCLATMVDDLTGTVVALVASVGVMFWLSETADRPRRRRDQSDRHL